MKKLFLFFILTIGLWVSSPSVAATENPERGMTAGVAIGLGKMHNRDGIGFIIRPSIGYRLNSDLELGGFVKYEHVARSINSYTLSAYSEYDFCHFLNNRLELFVETMAGVIFTYDNLDYGGCNEPHAWSAEIGFVPGLKYNLPDTNISLKLRYLFVGFNNTDSHYRNYSGCIGGGDWVIDAALRRLELGISVNF